MDTHISSQLGTPLQPIFIEGGKQPAPPKISRGSIEGWDKQNNSSIDGSPRNQPFTTILQKTLDERFFSGK
jgi:hypothetical protein